MVMALRPVLVCGPEFLEHLQFIGAGMWRAPRFRTADRFGTYIVGVNIDP